MWLRRLANQCHTPRRDRLTGADLADFFTGFGLESDLVDLPRADLCDAFSHRINVRCHLGLLGQDHGIKIDQSKFFGVQLPDRFDQEIGAITIFIFRGMIGKQSANVGARDRAEQRVGDRVQ